MFFAILLMEHAIKLRDTYVYYKAYKCTAVSHSTTLNE